MSKSRIALFDTASLYNRAFYGLPDTLRGPDGHPINAVRGLTGFLAHFLSTVDYTHAACCWDNDWRPGWRVDLVPSYKTHRLADPADAALPPVLVPRSQTPIAPVSELEGLGEDAPDDMVRQEPWLIQVLQAAGIAVVGADHHEADDVIATLARTAGMGVDVITQDRDLFQLVDDERDIRVLYTSKGVSKHEVIDGAEIHRRYGVRPQLYADFALLRGDASDGLPGVAGIGEKTAAALLAEFGDVAGAIAAAEAEDARIKPGVRAKLLAGRAYLERAEAVVRVADDIPLAIGWDDLALPAGIAHPDGFADVAARYNLGGAADRLRSAIESRTQTPPA